MTLHKFSFILLFFGLVACKPEFDKPCRDIAIQQTFAFTAQELSIFPYGTRDTLGFAGNLGDTIYFITDTLLSFNTLLPTTIKGNPECPQDNDAYAARQATFSPKNTIEWKSQLSKASDSIEFIINNHVAGMPVHKFEDSTFKFQDSVTYGSRTFYKVHSLIMNNGDRIVINSTFGLVYFTTNGRIYTLFKFNNK